MSLHRPLPVFLLPTARQRKYTFAPLVNPCSSAIERKFCNEIGNLSLPG
jgi:hypothetical protein